MFYKEFFSVMIVLAMSAGIVGGISHITVKEAEKVRYAVFNARVDGMIAEVTK